MKVKLSKDQVRNILKATYPEYRGRTFRLQTQETYQMENYWSGGSRTYVKGLVKDGESFKVLEPDGRASNPMNARAHAEFEIPKNVVMVEHVYFCGADLGIRLIVHPESELFPKLIGE